MTKYTTTIIRVGCNICDSPNIVWADGINHLCAKHHGFNISPDKI